MLSRGLVLTASLLALWACATPPDAVQAPREPAPPEPAPSEPAAPAAHHPTLLIKPGALKALRERLAQDPWREVAATACLQAASPLRRDDQPLSAYAKALRTDLNVAGLAWLSDQGNPRWHEAMAQALSGLPRLATLASGQNTWDGEVHVGNTVFSAMLLLDMAYDTVDPAVRLQAETTIGAIIAGIKGLSWSESAYALRGTWAIYSGDRAAVTANARLYRARWEEMISPDGVFVEGPGYALARMSRSDREQKHLFMDVLTLNGVDDWYHDARMQRAYRWLWAHAMTSNGNPVTFGDTSPGRHDLGLLHESAALQRTARFDQDAAGWAARFRAMNRQPPPAQLSSLLLWDDQPAPGTPPPSGIYPDGGAWLNAPAGGPLQSAMWNPQRARWHNHQDVNAIQLSESGIPLLYNVGYAGANRSTQDKSWEWINSTAESSNVLLAGTATHAGKTGGGIVDGWTTGPLQFATGLSGASQDRIEHRRTLLQVDRTRQSGGYWIVWDQVTGPAGQAIATPWHAASNRAPVQAIGIPEWTWTITDLAPARQTLALTVRLLTPTTAIGLRQGAVANGAGGYKDTYLYPEYALAGDGRLSISTLMVGRHDGLTISQEPVSEATTCTRISDAQGGCDEWWVPTGSTNGFQAAWLRRQDTMTPRHLALWEATAWASGDLSITASHPISCVLSETQVRFIAATAAEVAIRGLPGRLATSSGTAVDPTTIRLAAGTTLLTRRIEP
jgi:hypothetical protein